MPPEFEYVYKLFIGCEPLGSQISVGSETDNVGWFSEHELPELSKPRNIESQIKMMFEYHRSGNPEVFMD